MASFKVLLLFVFLCLVKSDADVCETPSQKPGICKVIVECSSLNSLLTNASLTNVSYLRKSHCGFEGIQPKVCCPNDEQTPENKENSLFDAPKIELNNTKRDLLPGIERCGYSNENKIVNGEIVDIGEFPFNALLKYKTEGEVGENFYCGGILISERYVLTAAHCIKGENIPKKTKPVSVRLGENNLETNPDCIVVGSYKDCAENFIETPIEKFFVHEDYNSGDPNQHHDIALLRLKNKVAFNDFVGPICLPFNHGSTHLSRHTSLFGWGIFNNLVSSLRRKRARFEDIRECNRRFKLNESQFCGFQSQHFKSCAADTGGALLYSVVSANQQNYYVGGIVSKGSCDLNQPLVFTNVSKYTQWIQNKLEE